MKKLLFTLITLCITIATSAQSVKSIRINGQDQKQKFVAISDIDSITHNMQDQNQTLWSKGNATPISFSNIESISFENSEVTYSYVENFVDSLDAIFTKDGYVALFGIQKSEGENISDLYNRIVTISKIDYETGTIDESKNIAILVDSLNIPSIIATEDYTYFISNLTENTFDCVIMSGDETWEYKNIPYSYPHNDANSRRFAPKRANGDIASSPVPPFRLGDLTNSIGMGTVLGTAITATTNGERISAGLGIVGSFAGLFNGEAGLLLSGLSDAAVKALGGSALALAGYLWNRNDKFILEHIGPWYVGIQSIEQTGRKSCTVKYSIDGIKSVKDGHPIVQLSVYHSDKNRHSGVKERIVQLGNAENGSHEYTIENLEAGYYKIYLSVIDDCHRAMNIRISTYPEILVRMYDIGIDRYEVQDNPSYSNGTVNFKMDVYLKGSEEGIGDDVQQFGYYTRYSNAIPDYKQVTYFSSIFESTPLTYELPIEREGFFEENRNYSTFEAKATGYYIGAYVVLKNGNIVTIDEQEIEGLIYKQKPSLTFTSYSLGETTVYVDENDEPYYCTTVISAEYTAKGTFWVNTVDLVVIQGNAEDNVGYWDVMNDGDQPFAAYYNYPYGGDNSCAFRFDFVLSNGNRVSSTNAIQVSGSPIVTNIGLIGANARTAEPSHAPVMKSFGKQEFKPRLVLKKD